MKTGTSLITLMSLTILTLSTAAFSASLTCTDRSLPAGEGYSFTHIEGSSKAQLLFKGAAVTGFEQTATQPAGCCDQASLSKFDSIDGYSATLIGLGGWTQIETVKVMRANSLIAKLTCTRSDDATLSPKQ